MKPAIGIDLLKEDAKRNGVDQMLMDLNAAQANGVAVSKEVEEWVVRVMTEGVAK